MIAFIVGLWANPLARKVIIYAAVILGILYGLRLWGNSQWAKGEAKGRQNAAVSIEKQKRDEWKAKEAAIAADTEILESERDAVNDARDQVARDRTALTKSLENTLAQIRQEKMRQYESVAAVPDNRLDSAIRSASRELAGSGAKP